MSGGWLDIDGPAGARREALREGLTRVGGPGCDVVLWSAPPGLPGSPGNDELQVWNRPPRALFLGRGPRPRCAGQEFDEHALRPGDRIEWQGHALVYGGEIASADLAPLEELTVAPVAAAAPADARFVQRLRAGLACELGLADAKAMKRWREEVLANRFDADACARELLARELPREAEDRLLERAGTLLRDFLMAALLRGAAGAGRKVREKTRGCVAFLVTQTIALLVFALLVAATLLVVRGQGTSLDALLDRLLPG